MDTFNKVLNFFTSQKTTIGYSIMAALTIGGERLFSMFSFQCPCNYSQNMAYGLTFLLGPAAVLLVVGLFFSERLWRLLTGCYMNPRKMCPRGDIFGCIRVLLKVTASASVAPVMWLCVALLNGTFYECAVSGMDESLVKDMFCKNRTELCREELARVPCGKSRLSPDDNTELLLMLRAQSQILGWIVIITAVAFGLISTCYRNCCSQVSYLQLTFWRKYMDKEKQQFDDFANNYADKLAERNLKSFFGNCEPEPFPFPNHTAWEKISTLYTFTRGEQCYSTLQQYVEHADRDYTSEKRPMLNEPSGSEII